MVSMGRWSRDSKGRGFESRPFRFQVHPLAQPPTSIASLPALGPWAPPADRGDPSLECIYRVSLTVDLSEGNKIIIFFNYFTTASWGPSKRKTNPGALGTCQVCPLVKTALGATALYGTRGTRPICVVKKAYRNIAAAGCCPVTATIVGSVSNSLSAEVYNVTRLLLK